MNLLKQISLSILIMAFCIAPTTTYAVGEKTALYTPIASGIAIGAATGGLSYLGTKNALIAIAAGLGVGGLSWFALDYYLSHLTPTARMKRVYLPHKMGPFA